MPDFVHIGRRILVSRLSVTPPVTQRNRPPSVGHKYRAAPPGGTLGARPPAPPAPLAPSETGAVLCLVTAAKLMSEGAALMTSRLAPLRIYQDCVTTRRGEPQRDPPLSREARLTEGAQHYYRA
jgi:hypothetical protein